MLRTLEIVIEKITNTHALTLFSFLRYWYVLLMLYNQTFTQGCEFLQGSRLVRQSSHNAVHVVVGGAISHDTIVLEGMSMGNDLKQCTMLTFHALSFNR